MVGCPVPFKVAQENFRYDKPTEKTDDGYFGNGIYFTQFLSYSDKYMQLNEQKGKIKRGMPFILSWVIMGKVYPVVERTDSPNTLLGTPCKPGYDSHYVLVKNTDPSQLGLDYQPCNPEDSVPDYDEVVVFDKDQVLPRYLVYYNRLDQPSAGSTAKKCHILWVDNNKTNNTDLIADLQSHGIIVTTLANSSSLMSWLALNHRESNKIRIISNRNRPGDGDESAGVRLLQWLRQKESEWQHIPFLLYCGNAKLVQDLRQGPDVIVTDSRADVLKFALN